MDSSGWAALAAWVGVIVSGGFAGWAAYSNRGAKVAQIAALQAQQDAVAATQRATQALEHMAHGPTYDLRLTRAGTGSRYRLRNWGETVTSIALSADGATQDFIRVDGDLPIEMRNGMTFDLLVLGPEVRSVIVTFAEMDQPIYLPV